VVAAIIFGVLTGVVVAFQLALALGAPWGEMAMGGKYPGRFPPRLRVAALIQSLVLVLIALVVFMRAGVVFTDCLAFSKYAIWFVVAFCGLSAILNVITPSKKEKKLWAPVAAGMLLCSVVVAFG